MLRCIYGIVHPDDHQELKIVLENSLADQTPFNTNQVSELRMKYHEHF